MTALLLDAYAKVSLRMLVGLDSRPSLIAGAIAMWLCVALPLSFRPIELAAMGGAAALVALMVSDGRGRRWEGFLLVAVYVGVAAGFYVAGDR